MANIIKAESKSARTTIRVRATANGYIGDGAMGSIYRNEGDVFMLVPREIPFIDPKTGKAGLDPDTLKIKMSILSAADQFSLRWMEVVDDEVPERLTTAQKDINRQILLLNSGSRPGSAEESEVA